MEPTIQEVKDLVEKQSVAWNGIEAKLSESEKEVKRLGQTTAETKTEIGKRLEDFGKLVDEAKHRMDAIETNQQKLASAGPKERAKTASELVGDSAELKAFNERNLKESGSINIKSLYAGRKDILEQVGSGLALIEPYRVPGIIMPRPYMRLLIRDLLTVSPISSPFLYYAQYDEPTGESSGNEEGGAHIVPEATYKPKVDLHFSLKTAHASTIACWLAASRQMLSDAAALRPFIDTQLLYKVALEEEYQLLYGDGIGDNLEGITTIAQVYNRFRAGDNMIDTLRKAITQVLLARFPATGFVINPSDWEGIELTKNTTNGLYVIGNPNTLIPARVWGLPCAISESMVLGDFLCGAFGLGATLYDLETANIRVAEQHEEFFVKNMVAVLAEERLMLVNFRPKAFVYGELQQASV